MSIKFLENNPNKPLPIGLTEKIAYGFGDCASCMLYVSTQAFLMFYYTEYVNINVGIVATIMLFSRFFDGFSDILMGHLIEKTVSPYGKARAWVIRMIIPFILGCVLLFSVPADWGETAKLIYVFFSYNFAITIVYTAINLPYGAMNTMMTQDSYERSVIVIFRMVLATVGNAFVTAATMPMVEFFGNDTAAWSKTFLVIGLLGGVMFFFTFMMCHERIVTPVQPKEKQDFAKSMKCLFSNRYWIMLTLAMVFVCCSDVTFNTVNIYFCQYFLGDAELVGTFGILMNVFRFVSMVFALPFLLKSIGKRNALLIACVLLVTSMVIRVLMPHSLPALYATAVFYGLGQGFTYTTLFAMIPDTVEYGEYKDGERHEGYIYAGASFGTKVAAGLGPVLMGFTLSLGGYVANAPQQTDSANTAILLASTLLPMLILVLGFLSMLGYHLDKEYSGIIKALGERKARKASLEN